MLAVLGVILLVAWLLGFVVFHVSSALIHVVLVVAIIMFVMHLVKGRNAT